jgi:alkanesulfonate monooxygenase SsuD/methylene tetrahydromethanopterin reductase-like flavin-dependent oxidoreductase (luciferase family)
MKLGLALGYSGAHLDIPVDLVRRAEALGYETVWTAEAYGSDAVTPLAYLAGLTRRHCQLRALWPERSGWGMLAR